MSMQVMQKDDENQEKLAEKVEEKVEENVEEKTFKPRSYQLEILEVAKVRNTLAFLPTASGKTLISVLLIKHRLRLLTLKKTLTSPKQCIAFLAPTRVLTSQQRSYIDLHCGGTAVVREYVGETSRNGLKIYDWTVGNWQQELLETDVMVFIPQVMKMLLQRALLPVSVFDLIVLDECHHAFGKDPMAIVCSLVKASTYRPLVLGMTASPLPCKQGKISEKIALLEETTGCRLLCPRDSLDDLKAHIPTPDLDMLRYGPRLGPENTQVIPSETASLMFREIIDKGRPEGLLSVRASPCAVMMHSYLRLQHADHLWTFYKLAGTLKMQPSELEERFNLGFTLPSAGTIVTTLGSSTLSDLQLAVGQIQRICADCGVLCGLWALANCMDKASGVKEALVSTSVSSVDFEKLEGLAEKLKTSPFEKATLLDGHRVACCSLIDLFTALASSLGPYVCRRAATNMMNCMNMSTDVSTGTGDRKGGNTGEVRDGREVRDVRDGKESRLIVRLLMASAELDKGNSDSERESDSDSDSDFSDPEPTRNTGNIRPKIPLGPSFYIGSQGVVTSDLPECDFKGQAYEKSINPSIFDVDDLKSSINDGCLALLKALTQSELAMLLALPLSAASIFSMGNHIKG
jgi:hypothetical protein